MDLKPIVKTRGGRRLDENRQRTAQTKFGFTSERVVATADAYMRGIAAGLNPNVRFADHGEIGPLLTADDDAEELLAESGRAGIDVAALASDLQREGATAFVDSWNELMAGIASKSETLTHSAALH
jgi:transaldolase